MNELDKSMTNVEKCKKTVEKGPAAPKPIVFIEHLKILVKSKNVG